MQKLGGAAAVVGVALIVWAFLGERSIVLLERPVDLGRPGSVIDTVRLAGTSDYLVQIGVSGAPPDACLWGGNLAAGASCDPAAARLVFDWHITVDGGVASVGSNDSTSLGTFGSDQETGVVLAVVRGEPGSVLVVETNVRTGSAALAGREAALRILLGPGGTDLMLARAAMRMGGGAILAMFGLLLVATAKRKRSA